MKNNLFKRMICILLTIVLMCMLLAGCGGKKDDGVLRILLIGNSFCYYYVDELWNMLNAAGVQAQVCDVYYSGCTLEMHWEWLNLEENDPNANQYTYRVYDENGLTEQKNWSLKKCLSQQDWDVISIQQHFGPQVALSAQKCMLSCDGYADNLYNYLKKNHKKADFYFQQSWAYQVGYDKANGSVATSSVQKTMHNNIRAAVLDVCSRLKLDRVPNGDAWALARADARIGDVLCNKGPNGSDSEGDFYHDGTTGGGQYLNACVWFETLTGKSPVGNTWRPTEYKLPEEKVLALQELAHQAIANMKAE